MLSLQYSSLTSHWIAVAQFKYLSIVDDFLHFHIYLVHTISRYIASNRGSSANFSECSPINLRMNVQLRHRKKTYFSWMIRLSRGKGFILMNYLYANAIRRRWIHASQVLKTNKWTIIWWLLLRLILVWMGQPKFNFTMQKLFGFLYENVIRYTKLLDETYLCGTF